MDVQMVTPVRKLEVPEAMHQLVEFSLRMIHSMVNDVLDDVVDVCEWQLKIDCRRVQGHHLAGTAEDSSSMYHGLRDGFHGFSLN